MATFANCLEMCVACLVWALNSQYPHFAALTEPISSLNVLERTISLHTPPRRLLLGVGSTYFQAEV